VILQRRFWCLDDYYWTILPNPEGISEDDPIDLNEGAFNPGSLSDLKYSWIRSLFFRLIRLHPHTGH
jgi:hypothetical protein